MSSREDNLRTWIEVDTRALRSNVGAFRPLISKKTLLMAVVKSNAYGHGLWEFAKACTEIKGIDPATKKLVDGVNWFGVDTMAEALRLRKEGIKKPILVLGYTMPALFREAGRKKISLTISSFENIRALGRMRPQPNVHIKIDTGLNRQGFLPEEVHRVIAALTRAGIVKEVEGVYTHLAAAKERRNVLYRRYTQTQLKKFERSYLDFEAHGFLPFLRHAAGTGAALLYPESRYDMIRIGIGLYGLWPSRAMQGALGKKVELRPILTWKTIVSEMKSIPAGSRVGYDLTERVKRRTRIAVLPVGYWHGYPRCLSSIGEVLIRGRRAKILGLVSMDMTVVDVSRIRGARIGDEVVLIGRQGREEITAYELAEKLESSHYETVTRINPLIRRIYR